MVRLMVLTFGVLGWSFYELSGGSDFVPATASAEMSERVNDVTRADTSPADLLSVKSAAASVAPVSKLQKSQQVEGVQLASFSVDKPAVTPVALVDSKSRNATKLVRLGAPEAAADAQAASPELSDRDVELRLVDGNRVNMRNGPGTTYSVLGKLSRGEAVEILQDNGDGWVKLRTVETGRVGWMADFLLASAN